MPAGLEVYNADGSVSFTTDTITGRYLGSFFTGTVNGSVFVSGFAGGSPWFFSAKGAGGDDTTVVCVPFITINGTTISWSFSDFRGQGTTANAPRVGCQVFYGVR